MGLLRQQPMPNTSKKTKSVTPSVREKTQPQGDPEVRDIQTWLAGGQFLAPAKVTGIYNQETHDALKMFGNSLTTSGDPRATWANQIIEVILNNPVKTLNENPSHRAQLLFKLRSAIAQPKQPEKKDTPYYTIKMPSGENKQIPLALIWNRGYPMYQAILEQEGLIDMSVPAEQRIKQLDVATRAILGSIDANDPRNVNILNAIREVDADLRQAWRPGSAGAGTSQSTAGTLADAISSYADTSAFSKMSDSQKDAVIKHIYYSHPYAEKFIEAPPSVNSKITNLAIFRSNRASITGMVRTHLSRAGLI